VFVHRKTLAAFSLAVFASALGTLGTAQAKEWKTATVALEGAYEPWNLTKPDGTLDGFEPELLKVVCERAKIECTTITQDWDGMIPALTAGKFDVIMDALSITDERKQTIGFTVPYAATPALFVTLKSGPLGTVPGTGTTITLGLDTAEQKTAMAGLRELLTGKTIGIQTSTIYAKFIYDNFQDVATIREYKTPAEHDLDLLSGRVDAVFDDATYFSSAFTRPENADMGFAGPAIVGPIWGDGIGLGLRQSDTDLKALLDAAIKSALADGTVKALSEKWFKVDVSPK
jgi:octopine/nopaline transport system substrate-binding protein